MPPLWITSLIGFLFSLVVILLLEGFRVAPSNCVIIITKSSISISSCEDIPDLTALQGFNLSGVDCTL
ncbi:TGB3 [Sweet potato virus F]|nr:TGB3 [Sweet potato virus F]